MQIYQCPYLYPSCRVDKHKWDSKYTERQHQYGEQSQGSVSTFEASNIAVDVPALQVEDETIQTYTLHVHTQKLKVVRQHVPMYLSLQDMLL